MRESAGNSAPLPLPGVARATRCDGNALRPTLVEKCVRLAGHAMGCRHAAHRTSALTRVATSTKASPAAPSLERYAKALPPRAACCTVYVAAGAGHFASAQTRAIASLVSNQTCQ